MAFMTDKKTNTCSLLSLLNPISKMFPTNGSAFLKASCEILSCSLRKSTAPASRPEGGSVHLTAWLPGNIDCDSLQCVGSQLSTGMHSFRLTQACRCTNVTAVGIYPPRTYLSHLTSHVYLYGMSTYVSTVH